MSTLITPRTMSGFRDYLPDVMLAREKVLDTTRRVYRSYGFTPIDTPAAEALDVLLGKGGDESDKLVYRVRSAMSEKEEMGLRFDLTVPFARFAAQYIGQLGTPFKRYAMGPVWRGERPGKGRYREFWQCDFDTIGTTSNAADIETALVINDLFTAIGFDKFEIRVNNRAVLSALVEVFSGRSDKIVPILRTLDKYDKIGADGVRLELMSKEESKAGLEFGEAQSLLDIMTGAKNLTNNQILAALSDRVAGYPSAQEGLYRLRELLDVAAQAGVPEGRIRLDPSIARGLSVCRAVRERFRLRCAAPRQTSPPRLASP